jgi:hypothetical protein
VPSHTDLSETWLKILARVGRSRISPKHLCRRKPILYRRFQVAQQDFFMAAQQEPEQHQHEEQIQQQQIIKKNDISSLVQAEQKVPEYHDANEFVSLCLIALLKIIFLDTSLIKPF